MLKNTTCVPSRFPLCLICVLFLLGIGCSNPDRGLIPITTSSEEAREYFRMGRDLFERLRLLEAEQHFRKAIEMDTNFALAYVLLATTETITVDRFAFLNRAVSLAGQVSEGERLLIRAIFAQYKQDRTLARQDLQKLVDLHPGDVRAHNHLGNNYLYMEDYENAVEAYQQAIKVDPEFNQAHNGIGYAYRYLGDHAQAEQAFLRYIELIPNDPNPYDSYAELLMEMGRFSESIANYQRALELNAYFFDAYEGMAACYNYQGQHAEARTHLVTLYDRARNVNHLRKARYALAVSYADEGLLDSALTQIQKSFALAEQAKDVLAMSRDLNVIGTIYLHAGKSALAVNSFKKAARLVRKSDLADEIKEDAKRNYLYNTARVAIQREDLSGAKKHISAYQEQISKTTDPYEVRLGHELAGMIALAEKDYATALSELEQASRRNPDNLYRLAQAYRGMGKLQQAEKMLQRLAGFYADNDINYALIRGNVKTELAMIQPR